MSKEKGFVLLYRDILNHTVFSDPYLFKLFNYCLLKASHKEREFLMDNNLIKLSIGEFIWGRKVASEELNYKAPPKYKISEKTWERKLLLLEKLGIVTRKVTNKYTIVKVNNWGLYQSKDSDIDQQNVQQVTNKSPTDDQQMTTDNNVKQSKTMYNNVVVPKNDFAEVINMYQENIQAQPPPLVIQRLSDDFDYFGKDIMKFVINKSTMKRNHDYRFIDYLLKQYRQNELKTIDQVHQYENQLVKRNMNRSGINKQNNRNQVDSEYQRLQIKMDEHGFDSLTDEEKKKIESYF